MNQFRVSAGFTLIELLVVISIIALLASVVLASLNSARTKAATAKAQSDMRTIVQAIIVAQGEQNKTLYGITGSTWTAGSCYNGTYYDMTTATCFNAVKASFTDIQNATKGLYPRLTDLVRDPWGNPYYLDENQGEGGDCTKTDILRSAGPDGRAGSSYNSDDVNSPVSIPASPSC